MAYKILKVKSRLKNEADILEVEGLENLETSSITALTSEQINSLQAGDVVLKITGNQKHAYIVSYKEDGQGICLTYTDASCVETVSYDKTASGWVYNSTDITPIPTDAHIKGLIQADKDILSQIEYDDDNRRIFLPVGILPLSIGTENDTFFLDYEDMYVLNDEGNVVGIIEKETETEGDYLVFTLNVEYYMPLSDMTYLNFINFITPLNGYDLYHPRPAGTKLYLHAFYMGQGSSTSFVNTRKTAYTPAEILAINSDNYFGATFPNGKITTSISYVPQDSKYVINRINLLDSSNNTTYDLSRFESDTVTEL